MKAQTVTMVRIYLTELKKSLNPLLTYLHDDSKVQGVTVFRAISGFGKSGKMHALSLLDLSLDLPVVVEFFDTPEKVEAMLPRLNTFIESGHLVYWQACINRYTENQDTDNALPGD